MREAQVVIVGGGVAGLASAYFLLRRGLRRIVLVEREARLAAHSSARNAAILRTATGDQATDALARESAEWLRSPPAGFTEAPLVDACGLCLAGASAMPAQRAELRAAGARELDGADLARLAPHWNSGASGGWLFEREGRIDLARLVRGFARAAARGGVEWRLGARVRELVVRAGRVCGVALDDGEEVAAQRTLLAAGAWAGELARDAGSPVRVRAVRRHLAWTRASSRVPSRSPVLWHDARPFYARAEGGAWLVSACDEQERAPHELVLEPRAIGALRARLAEQLPACAELPFARVWAGWRPYAQDERFLIGPDPALEALFWIGGLAGHGITCAAAAGELAAEWVQRGASAHPWADAHAPERRRA